MVGRGGAPIGQNARMLCITNGDAVVAEIAAACGEAPERILPWRDVLHDGPVPGGLGPAELAAVRAAHLAGRGWGDERAIGTALLERDRRLAEAGPDEEIVLWFEDDLFDHLQLAQIADRLAGRPGPVTLVALAHDRPESLERPLAERAPYHPETARFAALRSADPRDWLRFHELRRLAEELPDRHTGLSRLEREMAEALSTGPLHPADLFKQVAAREQPPWIGDAPLWALADDLAPLVSRNGSGYELSDEGRSVLAGDARRPPPERWLGGVQLGPGRPGWVWDAEAQTVVLLG
jgi:hypothetical protein